MNQEHEIVLYQVEDTNIYVNVMFKEDTFWMTQKAMADLFECTTDNISLHSVQPCKSVLLWQRYNR